MTTKLDSKIESGDYGYVFEISPIEQQIIDLREQGKTHQEIADAIGVSKGTIRTRMTVINEKLACQ